EIFSVELDCLRSITIKAAWLECRLLEGVKIVDAFRFRPEVFSLQTWPDVASDGGYNLGIGDLCAPAGLMLGLLVPPRKTPHVTLAQFELQSGEDKQSLAHAELELGFTADPSLVGRIDSNVMAIVDQLSVAKLKEQADIALAIGNFK